jgi:alpha-L-fucosidase
MKRTDLFMIGSLALALAGTRAMILTARAEETKPTAGSIAPGRNDPAQKPVTQHPVAEWFRDAKFGIYFHWGPYSVPAYENEWYSRNMYVKGSAAYKYHVAKYGGPEKFGYKDFIPQFTAEKFDADEWADLFERAGARFAGPVAEHADGWSNWDSKLTPWNAARMGPKKDITGLMAAAVRKRNMKFLATFHHQWLWGWYPTMDKTVDCCKPEYSGLYGPAVPPSAFDRNNPLPSTAFCDLWLAKVNEVVDKYQPDLIWFDSRLSIIGERYRQDMLAHYYGKEPSWGKCVVVTCKNGDLPAGASVLDLERGRMEKLADAPWLTDTAICNRSWCHIQDPDYKSAKTLVHTLIDIVSKNGCLLLDICPTAQGEIPQPQRERLLEMGKWLKVNGEAIYGTRPWKVFGEGPTQVKGGHFNEDAASRYTASDIRFTTKGGVLYAMALGCLPDGIPITIKSLSLPAGKVSDVGLLGCPHKIQWKQTTDGLIVTLPTHSASELAYALRISWQDSKP